MPRQAKAKVTPIWRKEARADHIYRVAAEIMCRKGYEATSMNDIADAVGLTKAGMYHYIQGKEHLLFEIMTFAMDMVDENVIAPTRDIEDPEERLRALVQRHAGRILDVGGEVCWRRCGRSLPRIAASSAAASASTSKWSVRLCSNLLQRENCDK